MEATTDGMKELIAVVDDVCKSELSWKEVLLNLKPRSLEQAPELAIGDGAPGFWKALRQVFPPMREHRSLDGQCSEQTSEESSASGQAAAARHLAGSITNPGQQGLRSVRF
jgi:hypothetical protein